ncbi:MAG: protein kinase [Polyangiaceae bacterium]
MRASEELKSGPYSAWLGRIIGERYEVVALLGTGGMGTVFRARDIELEEPVALKVLRRDLIEIPGVVERFRREVKLARRVTHRNVARVFDIGEHEGDRFLTMELVDGEPLGRRLARGLLPFDEALRISLAIAEGLAAAHAAGVVHRDLKPDNVLLANDGRVVITDFGIARTHFDEQDPLRTVGSAAVGTPAYMAPEQIEPDTEVDARADIYSLGAVMFELFTGQRAWPGESPLQVAAARLVQPPPDPLVAKPDLSPEYARILSRCLARSPADRFPAAEAVRLALRVPSPWTVQEQGPVSGTDDTPVAPASRPSARPPVRSSLRPPPPSRPSMTRTSASPPPPNVTASSTLTSLTSVTTRRSPEAEPHRATADVTAEEARHVLPPSMKAPSLPPVHPLRSLTPSATRAVAAPTLQRSLTPPSTRAPLTSAYLTPGSSPSPFFVPSAPGSSPGSGPRTVAVLPFRNAGGPEDEYLADGLTDELIDTLSMTEGLRVRSRGVVMAHKGADADPRDIGKKLEVGLVIEGSVRRTGAAVRITARIVSVADGSQIWAKRFDHGAVDVFVASDEVARAVAEALTLDHDAAPPPHEAPTDPEAVDLYLRGRQEYRKYWPDAVKRAVQLYEEALARAPYNPTIQSAYALACARLWWFGGDGGSAAGAKARSAAEAAMAVAPHLGEPHLALAQVLWNSADAKGAAREIKLAIERTPTLAEAHALRGRVLVEGNRLQAGIKALQTGVTLEPNVPLALGELARAYAFLGRWDEIPAIAERNAEIEGPQALWFSRARFALWRRDRETAQRFLEEMKAAPRVLAVARWIVEQIVTAEAPPEELDLMFFVGRDDASARRRSFVYQIEAEVRAFHRQGDAVIASVERSVSAGLFDLAWMLHCPLLTPLHEDPRFQRLRAIVEARVNEVMPEIA